MNLIEKGPALLESMPEAILLDLDDTIVAWDAVLEQSWSRVCLDFASEISDLNRKMLSKAVKKSSEAKPGIISSG